MLNRITMAALLAVSMGALAACSGPKNTSMPAPADGPLIVQPGAPGESSRVFSADDLDDVSGATFTEADVQFMQGMIPHHQQALQMTALVREHAATNAVRQMALRMEISQRDEIKLMEAWLTERGQPVEMSMGSMGGMHGGHHNMVGGLHVMPGMLTAEQMEALANARGVEFDRLFLEGMIQHHQGAIDMVETLFNSAGAAQESTIFKFAEDVDADQQMEIDRMRGLLRQLR
ncbi:MAG: DUF305 domain-containing protein [Rhodothermales bacterium]